MIQANSIRINSLLRSFGDIVEGNDFSGFDQDWYTKSCTGYLKIHDRFNLKLEPYGLRQ